MHGGLGEKDVLTVRQILADLLVSSEADHCLVCDSGGYVVAEEGSLPHDQFLISALGAGVFGASRELARILGEDEFSAVLHQGEKRSIFIHAIDTDHLLVVVFSTSATVGLVKFYSTPAAQQLRQLIEEIATRRASPAEGLQPFVLTSKGNLFGGKA